MDRCRTFATGLEGLDIGNSFGPDEMRFTTVLPPRPIRHGPIRLRVFRALPLGAWGLHQLQLAAGTSLIKEAECRKHSGIPMGDALLSPLVFQTKAIMGQPPHQGCGLFKTGGHGGQAMAILTQPFVLPCEVGHGQHQNLLLLACQQQQAQDNRGHGGQPEPHNHSHLANASQLKVVVQGGHA